MVLGGESADEFQNADKDKDCASDAGNDGEFTIETPVGKGFADEGEANRDIKPNEWPAFGRHGKFAN